MAIHTYLVEGYDKSTDLKVTKHVDAKTEEEAITLSRLYVKKVELVSAKAAKPIAKPKRTKQKARKSSPMRVTMLAVAGVVLCVLSVGLAMIYPFDNELHATTGEAASTLEIRATPIMSGTSASKVESILGEPNEVKKVTSEIGLPATCWVYDDVKIYLNDEGNRLVVTHWEGDLKEVVAQKTKD